MGKKTQTTNVGEDVRKKENLYTSWWKCELAPPLWKVVWKFLRTLKIELLYGAVIPLLGIY
jgi:hypothetical protein